MGDDKKAEIPRLVPSADVTSLPLGPAEGFVLSRIDGAATVDDIGDMTGLGGAKVREVVAVLVANGVAEWVEPTTPRARHSQIRMPTPSRGLVRTKPPPPGASLVLYDPVELEEPEVDLDLERRRTILDTFYRLDDLTFYDLLGVEPTAEKKVVRHAYFKLSKTFHPDTLFGKRLGTYKQKMEAVFKRLTEAYDVLGKKRTRQEYDAYIKLRARTQAAQNRLAEGARVAERIEREVVAAVSSAVVHPESSKVDKGSGVVERPGSEADEKAGAAAEAASKPDPAKRAALPPPPPIPESNRPMSAEARERQKRLMARKIAAVTGRRMPVHPSKQPPSPISSVPPARRDDLLRGLAHSLKQASAVTGGVDRVKTHLEAARHSEGEGNLVAAANSLRLAVALAPDDEQVEAEYRRVCQALAVSLADSYEQQAKYEERAGRYAEAALSWSRVCDGRPEDPMALLHAATCLVDAGGDLAKAKQYAQKAVDLSPDHPLPRRALGRVFHAAGMKLNAKREFEAALKLDPHDEMVKNLLRELGK